MLGRVLLISLSAAALGGSFAQPGSAQTGLPSAVCATAHARTARRTLASASVHKVQRLCAQAHKPASKLRFWNNREHRWTLYPQHKNLKCGELHHRHLLVGPEKLCFRARTQVRHSTERLTKLVSKIKQLLPQPKVPHNWLYNSFRCIHRYEGAWNANTSNGYYGGLQMDLGFQGTYGAEFMRRWGTADQWPPWAQIIAAERAYQSGRGFGPWPNTARTCGFSTTPVSPGLITARDL